MAGSMELSGSQEHRETLNVESVLVALDPICQKWKLVGIAMGIEPSNLDRFAYIYPHLPENTLLEVIKEWLTVERSWEELVRILRSRSLEEIRLAGEVEEKYCNSDTPQTQPVLCARLQQVIERSTAIEVQSHSLPVYQVYAAYLKGCYSGTDESAFPRTASVRRYINLATVIRNPKINRSQADAFTKDTLHHGIDEILAKKERLEMKEILKPVEGHSKIKLVFVEGPPGVGKSTLAWELCNRWDDIPDLKKFSLVVLLRFRDRWVQEAKSIADLFYHDDPEIQQAVAKEVCRRSGEGVLFILDGFDEFPAPLRESSLLLDIMKGSRCLSRCTVIVTSRPSVTSELLEECQVDKHVEVLGFTQKQIEEYSLDAFGSEPQLLSDFRMFCTFNPAIRSMMYIPINTVIVASVFLSTGRPLSHTITQLYIEMSIVILKAHAKKIGCRKLYRRLQARKFEDLPSEVLSHLKKLGKLAFMGIVYQKVIFNELPTDCEHFGFLNASPELHIRADPVLSYYFLHRSFQEFFTAFYISQLTPSEQVEIFNEHFEKREGVYYQFGNDAFIEVWKFLAGLSSFKGIGWDLVESQSSIQQLVSYLYEAQDLGAPDSVFMGMDEHSVFNPTTLFDCYAVGWCIGARTCKLGIAFSSMESGAEAFVTGVTSECATHEPCGIVSGMLFFNTPNFKEEDVCHLSKLPLSLWQKMSWLDVSNCQLNATAVDKLADLAVHMVSLARLAIRSNHVGEGGLVKLFTILSMHGRLEKVHLGDNCIGCADVEAMARLIKADGGCLKKLTIKGERNMSPDCQRALIESIFSPSSIEVLCIHSVKVFHAAGAIALLENNHNLIGITAVCIGKALALILCSLEDNRCVEALKIDCTQAEVPALRKLLSKNSCLQKLKIKLPPKYTDDIRRKTCLDIVNALQQNSTVKEFGLYLADKKLFTQTELDAMDSRVTLHEHTDKDFAIE